MIRSGDFSQTDTTVQPRGRHILISLLNIFIYHFTIWAQHRLFPLVSFPCARSCTWLTTSDHRWLSERHKLICPHSCPQQALLYFSGLSQDHSNPDSC